GLAQQMLEPLQRNRLTLGVPAHLRGLGEAINLSGLHERPPRREPVGAAILTEAIDKAARRGIPALARPQRQGALDDQVFHSDAPPTAAGGRPPHCNPRPPPRPPQTQPNPPPPPTPNRREPPMPEHYDALKTRAPASREADLFARLPGVLRKAMEAPAYAERLKGIDPAQITSRTALASLPVLRKSELPALHKAAPPFGGFVAASPGSFARLFT